ncbi:MAG: hypothetical protein K940chlam3_01037 [Chlamydiae bacterium]|nr:hypothetical protein [Chlamydiota bacterium]
MYSSHEITLNNNVIPTGDASAEIRLDPVNILPVELILYIFSYLMTQDLVRCELVARRWQSLTKDEPFKKSVLHRELKKLEAGGRFIGEDIWNQYIGDVGEVPPLPDKIIQILFSACPWKNPGKKKDGARVKDTHIFGLIPATVNGKSLTLNSIEDLVKSPKKGYSTKYRYIWDQIKVEHGDTSYWALMTIDVLDGSRGENLDNQLPLAKRQTGYRAPTLRDAVIFNFLPFVIKEERLLGIKPCTYTCCQGVPIPGMKFIVGGFGTGGLYVGVEYSKMPYIGVVALRKF